MSHAAGPSGARAGGGGIPARRAIIRWVWRLFRREWRQQLLVTALLVLAVTAATTGISAAYSLIPLGQAARLGDANQMFIFDGLEPDAVGSQLAAIEEQFGAIDVIGRWYVPIPGAADIVEFRAQDPEGAYGARMLAVLDGRYPTDPDEVAVTDAVATTFDLDVGARFTLGGDDWSVVGLVENPTDLGDEFALVAPPHADAAQTLNVLVRGPEQGGVALPPEVRFDWEMAGQTLEEQQIVAASVALAVAAVAMVLVSLVATAGFVVIAQRRRRQLGMLAAMGATRRHLRLVTLANGAAVGATAAVVGTVLAFMVWIVAAPYVEAAVEARIDPLVVLPWWLLASSMLLAVVAATAAAWWPARAVARLPVALALSGQPTTPRPARRSAALAGALIVAGVVSLLLGGRTHALLIGAGTVATVVGILLLSPLALRTLAAGAMRLPVAVRLALRDLGRYHTRSGAALAAVTLGLGIAATVVVATTVAERTSDSGNLSPDQILVTVEGSRIRELVTDRTPAQIEELRAHVNRMAALPDDAEVIELQMAVDPTEEPNEGDRGITWRHAVQVGDGPETANPGPLFVATPQLLALYGIDPQELDTDTEVLTVRTGEIGLRFGIDEEAVTNVERVDLPDYTSAPTTLITPSVVRRYGWEPAFVGWLLDAGQPLTSAQISEAHSVAARADLQIETRQGLNLGDLRTARSGAMAAGMIVALAVLAMTVGLIRSEAAGDLRVLAATGASTSIRRALTATTAGTLALLGAVLGTFAAYLALAAGFIDDRSTLIPLPAIHLLVIVAGVPLAAAAAGWLLGGRQPSTLAARGAIE